MPARQRRLACKGLAWQRPADAVPGVTGAKSKLGRQVDKVATFRGKQAAPSAPVFAPDDSTLSQIEADAGHFAGVIARRTSFANIGPHGVNGARRRYPDLAHKGTATVSIAAHAPVPVIDEGTRNPIKVRVGLQGEPRPIGGKRAARAASQAHQARVRRHPGCVRHDPVFPPRRHANCAMRRQFWRRVVRASA
jgi:hypothetical protein